MADPLTAAELREIGERVRELEIKEDHGEPAITQAQIDRSRLFAALERLIDRHLYGDFATQQIKDKDAAIDALLGANP